jgi:hypothetical protein
LSLLIFVDIEFLSVFPLSLSVSEKFVCSWLHEQFFSCLAAVTIIGDRAANFALCTALKWLLAERVLLYDIHLLQHGTSVYTVSLKWPEPQRKEKIAFAV